MTLLNKKRLKSWSDDHELEADEKGGYYKYKLIYKYNLNINLCNIFNIQLFY